MKNTTKKSQYNSSKQRLLNVMTLQISFHKVAGNLREKLFFEIIYSIVATAHWILGTVLDHSWGPVVLYLLPLRDLL